MKTLSTPNIRGKIPTTLECPRLIDFTSEFFKQGEREPSLIIRKVPESLSITNALNNLQYKDSSEIDGVRFYHKSESVLGYINKNTSRGWPEGECEQNKTKHYEAFKTLAKHLSEVVKTYFPGEYKSQKAFINSEQKNTHIPQSIFTTAICSHNNAMVYHLDKNVKENFISALVISARDTEGGELCVPEFGIRVMLDQPFVCLYKGKKLWHGVRSMKVGEKGYRNSALFYAIKDKLNDSVSGNCRSNG